MHSKKKGNIGQFATGFWLSKHEYSVFTEEGDISPIDLIAEKSGKLLKFQCKAVTPTKGILGLNLRKTGPNGYVKVYEESQIDYFSVYDLHNEKLYFVPSSVLRSNCNLIALRLDKPKNNQSNGVRFAEDYLADKILRDYTGNTPLDVKSEGDDIVQTTT